MGRLLHTDLKMMFCTKRYYITLASTVLAAALSILVIKLMAGQYNLLSEEIIGMIGNGDIFNLYVIKVKDIKDILDLTGSDMMYLCFSSCFLPGVIAVFSARWVTYGYKTGMVRFLVSRGYPRSQIAVSKFISAAIGIAGIALFYLGVSAVGGGLLGGMGKLELIGFGCFFAAQVAVHVVFGFLCMAAAYLFENDVPVIVCMLSLLVAMPDLLKYLKIFTNGKADYEWLWILNYSSELALREPCPLGLGVFLLVLVSVVSVIVGIMMFEGREIR